MKTKRKRKLDKRKNYESRKERSSTMITVYAKCDCGCCTAELKFRSEESARVAFERAGLGNGVTIVDDEGQSHTGLDTFYGFSTGEEEQGGRSLGYLAGLMTGTESWPSG